MLCKFLSARADKNLLTIVLLSKEIQMKLKTLPIFLTFLCMGFGDVVNPLVELAKKQFNLTGFEASLIPSAGFIMFGLLSVPMGLFQDRKGKKFTLMIGLVTAFIGLIIPVIIGLDKYATLICSILVLGAGATILQVSGNPIMRDVSAEGKYSRNLSFGQFVKAIGTLSGAIIPVIATRYFTKDWTVLFPVYAICVSITAIAVGLLKVNEHKETGDTPASFGSCIKLLSDPFIAMMVFGIFLYVGAECSVGSAAAGFLKEQYEVDVEKLGLVAGTGLFFAALTIGRFSGGMILNWMKPKTFLILTAILSIVGIAGLAIPSKAVGIASFFLMGLGFANIFPLVFSITVDAMPKRANEISGLMVTAIVGGAFLPPLRGFVADKASVLISFLVPLAAIAYILIIGFVVAKHPLVNNTSAEETN